MKFNCHFYDFYGVPIHRSFHCHRLLWELTARPNSRTVGQSASSSKRLEPIQNVTLIVQVKNPLVLYHSLCHVKPTVKNTHKRLDTFGRTPRAYLIVKPLDLSVEVVVKYNGLAQCIKHIGANFQFRHGGKFSR